MADEKPDQPGQGDTGIDDWAMIASAKRDAEIARRAQSSGGPASPRAGGSGLSPDSFAGYEILHEIHRGGQGVVYQAVQKSTNRKVALKVMREGPFASLNERARFEREVHILGQLKHPNIVAIHDSGQSGGHQFFVMDYISGQPLDAWMAGDSRSVEDTLRLFMKVCDAVNAAHLQGITHRDLKPGNIRVDEAGEPHVLDFGLAKAAMESQEAAGAAMTVTGQFLGSLPWASPEQAEGVPAKIDLRTDVYSLGVILYQMLTGRLPYEVIGNIRDVLDRILRAEPVRPSTIRRQINDEVETVVLKCLAKDRERRYQSAGELARDIGRYLAGEPIEAKRDSAKYLLRKYLRRHRVPAAVAVGFLLVVAAGLVVSLTFWGQAVAERGRAEQARGVAEERRAAAEASAAQAVAEAARAEKERDKAERINGFMQQTLAGTAPSVALGRDTTMLREMMDAAAKRIEDGELQGAPEAELRLRLTIGRTYCELAAYDSAERMLRPAVDLSRAIHAGDQAEVAASLNELALLLKLKGDLAAAEALMREALAIERKLPGDGRLAAGATLHSLAMVLESEEDYEGAEPFYREALALQREVLGDNHPDVATDLSGLGGLMLRKGDYAAAEPLLREALAVRRKLLGEKHTDVGISLYNLAELLCAKGDYAAAEPLYRESLTLDRELLGDEHPSVATTLLGLAGLQIRKGDDAAAEPLLREALAIYRRALGNEHSFVALVLYRLGALVSNRGDDLAAEPLFREAVAICEKRLPPSTQQTANARAHLAFTLVNLARKASASLEERKARLAEAEGLLQAALEVPTTDRDQRLLRMFSMSRLYDTWHTIEPDKGYDQKASVWRRAKMAEMQASTQPAPQSTTARTTQE